MWLWKVGANMPRKNANARHIPKPKRLKIKKKKAVLVRIEKRWDEMSPGRLVGVAEWR